METLETVEVLNTPCVLTDHGSLTRALEGVCSSPRKSALSVDFTNVHIVAMRAEDPDFARITDTVDWFVSDSQVLTWAISLLGGRNHTRVYGPDFLDYCVRHSDVSLKHYFLGGSQACLDQLMANLRRIRPELQIVGSHNGYFKEEDSEGILADIAASKPDLVWVGLGTPKQQEWISRHKERIDASAALAVGFAFDVNAGTKSDAPRWLGPLGLTWLYRLACEPRRLWHRYFHYNTVFLRKLYLQAARD